jgi:hypothetical protein
MAGLSSRAVPLPAPGSGITTSCRVVLSPSGQSPRAAFDSFDSYFLSESTSIGVQTTPTTTSTKSSSTAHR